MASLDQTPMTINSSVVETAEEQLSRLFGSYRAEWLHEQLFDLFMEPSYFPALKTPRPCVLEGGRGTGKTTVLKCLSYQGQYALSGKNAHAIKNLPYYGFYYRINTNRVTAFRGPELAEPEWVKAFAHYFNLELCGITLRFLEWYRELCGGDELCPDACQDIAVSLALPNAESSKTVRELLAAVERARIGVEAYINNVADRPKLQLSLQGAPVDLLFRKLHSLGQFQSRYFFFLVDEYENLLEYQQKTVNTLIKHSGEHYTFKIGVRELAWQRATHNEHEYLISPSDYVRIDIAATLGDRFDEFATAVCNERLRRIPTSDGVPPLDVASLLPDLSEDEEAELLGVRERLADLRRRLKVVATDEELLVFDSLPPLKAYFIGAWALTVARTSAARDKEAGQRDILELNPSQILSSLRDLVANPKEWDTRYSNYKYSTLFTIHRGKRGIQKYYAGWRVFTQLAASNIRYLLELLDNSLMDHVRDGKTLSQPMTHELQTLAAQKVGHKYLTELEGLSVGGAKLTRLLLGLGRVFQVMAANPIGHAPEVVQFRLANEPLPGHERPITQEVEQLLRSAVFNLALLRFPGSKLPKESGETKEYDYQVHPLYSAFFVYSYRRKRKMLLTGEELWGLVQYPKITIERLLKGQRRPTDEPLPTQLSLFEGFYVGGT